MQQRNITELPILLNPQTTVRGPLDPNTSLTSAQEVAWSTFYAIYLSFWGPLDPSGGKSVSLFSR